MYIYVYHRLANFNNVYHRLVFFLGFQKYLFFQTWFHCCDTSEALNTMTEVLLEHAEELFLKKDLIGAYKKAKLAQALDPFFGSVDKYVAAFRVHVASLHRNRAGEIDWYDVLGVESSVPEEAITHRFCKMGKFINPDVHCSKAADGAYKLLCRAYEVLGDSSSREAFHRRWGLNPPPTKASQKVLSRRVPDRCFAIQKRRRIGFSGYALLA